MPQVIRDSTILVIKQVFFVETNINSFIHPSQHIQQEQVSLSMKFINFIKLKINVQFYRIAFNQVMELE